MQRDRLTNLYDESILEDLLEIEMARAERYGRHLGFVAAEPRFSKPLPELAYQALRKLAVLVNANTRKVDMRFRWGNAVLLLLPETPIPGLETVAKKLRDGFAAIEFQHSLTGVQIRGELKIMVAEMNTLTQELQNKTPRFLLKKLQSDFRGTPGQWAESKNATGTAG